MPRESKNMRTISAAYQQAHMNIEETIVGTRRLLGKYRSLKWLASCTMPTPTAITAHTQEAQASASYLRSLIFEHSTPPAEITTHPFALDLMHHALEQVGAYPERGEIYRYILYHAYFAPAQTIDEALMQALHLERSLYYAYKREAIALFALVLVQSMAFCEEQSIYIEETQAQKANT